MSVIADILDSSSSARPGPIEQRAAVRRVFHLVNGEHYAGAERVQDWLALRLPEFGYQVTFGCLKPDKFPEVRRSKPSPLVPLAMRSRADLRPIRALVHELRQGYALLHAHTPRALLLGAVAARWAGVPLVYHVHSPAGADSMHRVRNWVNARLERAALRQAAAVIAVSESLGRHCQDEHLAPGRIHVVHNGVPVAGELALRPTPNGIWNIGTVALFRPRKGVEVLLEALSLLRKRGLNVRLTAIGGFETSDYERTIHEHAAKLGVADLITWSGFTLDVMGALGRLDLCVLPSLFGEGLPMVVLEAMAAGIPVVATRVEGVPEALRDGLDGVLAEPGSAEDLAAKLESVIRGDFDWQKLRRSAHERQAVGFSDRSLAEGVARVYDEVLAR